MSESIELTETRHQITTLIVDDADDVVESLAGALAEFDDIKVVGKAANGAQGVLLTRLMRPDVVLMDLRMPVMDGINATRQIVREELPSHILMLTAYDDDSLIRAAMDAGADGYLVKGTLVADTVEAIRAVMDPELSSRRRSFDHLES